MVNIATWADVKAAFRRRYNIDCDVTSKQRMFGATQRAGESCTDFAYRKLDLMEQCNYPVLQKEKCQVIMATLSDKAKKHFFDKNFEKLNDMIDSFLRFDQISNTEENVKVLVAVEPPTSQTTERPVLVKRSSRKSMRNRQRKESMESSGLPFLEEQLTESRLRSALNSLAMKDNVELTLPKFKLEYSASLKDVLSALGAKDLFSDSADLSGIFESGKASVSQVFHKAFVQVDEEGTEAAAATAEIGAGSTAPSDKPVTRVVVDRPFMFLIRKNEGNVILFMGSVRKL
ncbi:hypothetical protein HPB49_021230 [Dermacentor silvarum]|uniref:Uncharacterized protein n=1 Tax=Dermacentor silvarum TaxID=543639 RepID=A0ACB8CHH8_DERSI|nr:hypothetical protein HPB49_021230 [Dermacentor silvarum]